MFIIGRIIAYPLPHLIITSLSPISKYISVIDNTADLIYKYDVEHENIFLFDHIYKKHCIILKK